MRKNIKISLLGISGLSLVGYLKQNNSINKKVVSINNQNEMCNICKEARTTGCIRLDDNWSGPGKRLGRKVTKNKCYERADKGENVIWCGNYVIKEYYGIYKCINPNNEEDIPIIRDENDRPDTE